MRHRTWPALRRQPPPPLLPAANVASPPPILLPLPPPTKQVILLELQLEEMENVESVSLPPGACYMLDVKNSQGEDVREQASCWHQHGGLAGQQQAAAGASVCAAWERGGMPAPAP